MPRTTSKASQLLFRSDQQSHRHVAYVDDSDLLSCLPRRLRLGCSKRKSTAAAAAAQKLAEEHVHWRASQRSAAWRLERQLHDRWTLDDLIDSHLAHLHAHYHRAMLPSSPADVARLLMPPWNPPLESAAVCWLGDWRPSAILSLVPLLAARSPRLAAPSSRALRSLAEASYRLRVHEAVIDQEVAESQAMCVLQLPFARREGSAAVSGEEESAQEMEVIGRQMRKMERVLERAQRLRYRAVEVVVRNVLDRTQAAEFLVAFAGIQELVRRKAARWNARVGPAAITLHAFDAAGNH